MQHLWPNVNTMHSVAAKFAREIITNVELNALLIRDSFAVNLKKGEHLASGKITGGAGAAVTMWGGSAQCSSKHVQQVTKT